MPDPLRAKSQNPDASGSLCNFVSELSRRTRQVIDLSSLASIPQALNHPIAGGLQLRVDRRGRFGRPTGVCLAIRVKSMRRSGSLLALGFF
jgi:hypothetical protein